MYPTISFWKVADLEQWAWMHKGAHLCERMFMIEPYFYNAAILGSFEMMNNTTYLPPVLVS